MTSRDGRQVTGVDVRAVDGPDGHRVLDADLVVDASGRLSRADSWLTDIGCGNFSQTQIDSKVSYASRIYRIPDGFRADWKLAMLFSRPPSMARGYLYPIEDHQWIVALMGTAGEHPPTEEDGFGSFAHDLRHRVIADALATAEPVTPIRSYRGTANRWWHYQRAHRWPDRFVVLCDAVCAFNPIYGQGMSSAAIAAETLDACLRDTQMWSAADRHRGWARNFQQRLARVNTDLWMMATREDLRYPSTTGAKVTPVTRLQHRYLNRVGIAATRDPAVAHAYSRVFGLLDNPRSLLGPRILARAVRARSRDESVLPPPPLPAV